MYIVQLKMVNENLYPSSYFILNYIIAENEQGIYDSKGK